ncbi:MAG: DUF1840 domain-containing protein [Rubrivivax sp.]|nr:DUF1840 domain-containing protein [Rubrivivax sp.]
MIYKFKSAATGDVIMLGPHGDQLLRLLGREPALKGIIEPGQMAAAVQALQAAIVNAEAAPDEPDEDRKDAVVLRQRLWPMIEMLRRAQRADEPVVWGV